MAQALQKYWLTYMSDVLPKNLPSDTLHYCEQSYYAGVAAALREYGAVVGPHNPVPEALVRIVDRMCGEVLAFARSNTATQEKIAAERTGTRTDN